MRCDVDLHQFTPAMGDEHQHVQRLERQRGTLNRSAAHRWWAWLRRKVRQVEVVYTELGESRRRILHRRALSALEGDGVPAAELARHALAAGLAEAAMRHSVAAGDAALAVFAVRDALAQYERAESLLPAVAAGSPPLEALAHLFDQLGRAAEGLGEWARRGRATKRCARGPAPRGGGAGGACADPLDAARLEPSIRRRRAAGGDRCDAASGGGYWQPRAPG